MRIDRVDNHLRHGFRCGGCTRIVVELDSVGIDDPSTKCINKLELTDHALATLQRDRLTIGERAAVPSHVQRYSVKLVRGKHVDVVAEVGHCSDGNSTDQVGSVEVEEAGHQLAREIDHG